jgi:CheY-like chemotaxis protein
MTQPLVLIIEDDPQLSQIFTVALETQFSIEAIIDGNTALGRLEEVVPDIVVLDLHLPGSSGADVLAKIRGDERLAKVKVILATADARQADLLTNEADIVLLKPVSPVQLRAMATRLHPAASTKDAK